MCEICQQQIRQGKKPLFGTRNFPLIPPPDNLFMWTPLPLMRDTYKKMLENNGYKVHIITEQYALIANYLLCTDRPVDNEKLDYSLVD